MHSEINDWRAFLRSQGSASAGRAGSAIHFIEQHCKRLGVLEPTLKDIEKISKEELLSGWTCMATVHRIELLQQQIRKENGGQ